MAISSEEDWAKFLAEKTGIGMEQLHALVRTRVPYEETVRQGKDGRFCSIEAKYDFVSSDGMVARGVAYFNGPGMDRLNSYGFAERYLEAYSWLLERDEGGARRLYERALAFAGGDMQAQELNKDIYEAELRMAEKRGPVSLGLLKE